LLRFENLPDKVKCTDAQLYLPVVGDSDNGFAYPIITRNYEYIDDNTRLRLIDYNNGSSFTYAQAAGGIANVTNAVNAAIRYGSDTILMSIETGLSEGTLAPPAGYGDETLTITYEQY